MSVPSFSFKRLQPGFVLLPVVMAISLIGAIAFLMNREAALNVNTLGGEIASMEALYAAKAGLSHMLWQLDQSGCSGYSNIGPTPFGKNSYSVSVNPTSGSPVSITATGTHPSGATYTIKRDGVEVGRGPAQTKVIQPTAAAAPDTYISNANPTVNYGTSLPLYVTQHSGIIRKALLQFDLSRFTPDASIVNADLSLYQNAFSSLGGSVSVHRVLGSVWSETFATWNNRNTGTPWTTVGGDYDTASATATTIPDAVMGWFSWNIASLVKDLVSGVYPNNGWVFIPDTDNLDVTFISSDQASTFIPKITVTYTCPCGVECYTSVPPVMVTLNAVADALIDSQNANRNYGASTTLNIKYTNATNQKRSVLKFDTSGIPVGALIQSAKLRLNVASVSNLSADPKTISAYTLTQSWTQGSKTGTGSADGVTWNTRNGSTAWTTSGGSYQTPGVALAVEESSGISPPPAAFSSGWLNWDLTALTQEWVDGITVNNGVILISTVQDEQIIDSKEKGGNTNPQLVVTYQE